MRIPVWHTAFATIAMQETDVRQDTSAAARVGLSVGPYRILRVLGQGGMGVVYEAVHEQIGGRAAIKVLSASRAAEPRFVRRFLTEARAASAVRHPGLVQIFDFGQLPDGAPYMLMELLAGETLRERLRRNGRFGLGEGLRIGWQVASALAAAHEGGVVHRDLKPENLMILPDPAAPDGARARVLDFGVAKLLDGDGADPTPAGTVLGTAAYVAPEQWLGAPPCGRADVYALGVILYEVLSGRQPFQGSAAELMTLHLHEDPPPLSQLRATVPGATEALVTRMLAKAKALRPSMAEVAQALRPGDADAYRSTMESPMPLPAPTMEEEVIPSRAAAAASGRGPAPARRWIWRAATLGSAAAALLVAGFSYRAYRTRPPSGMLLVQGGSFAMGSPHSEILAAHAFSQRIGCNLCRLDLYEREQPVRQVRVSPFYLDRTEVTNRGFAEWLDRRPGVQVALGRLVREDGVLLADLFPGYSISGLAYEAGHFRARPGLAEHPVTQVTWDAAVRFCQDRGGRLPTEAEWEQAARPGRSRFPWGDDEPRCEGVVYGRSAGLPCVGAGSGPAEVATAPKDRTPIGLQDLGGNVAEWVADRFRLRYAPCGACVDPQVQDNTDEEGGPRMRVVRGGSWYRPAESCRAAGRSRRAQDELTGDIGFRCARSASTWSVQ